MYEGIAAHLLPWLSGGWAPPYRIHLFPTDRCNLKCRSCWRWHVSQDGEISWVKDELSDKKLLSIIDDGIALGVREWEFTGGGEPLVRKNVVLKMMGKIKEGKMRGEITTNGTLFTPEIVEFMVKIGWDGIILSLDGPNSEINDYLRPPQGSFKRIISMLELFKKYKKSFQSEYPEISIQCVLSKINLDYIVPMIQLTADYGVKRIIFEPVKHFSYKCAELMLNKQDYEKIKEQAKEALKISAARNIFTNVDWLLGQPEYIGNIGKMDNFLSSSYVNKLNKKKENCFLGNACYEPWYRMFISAIGEVAPCCLAVYDKTMNIKHNSLLDIWQGKFYRDFRKSISDKRFPVTCKQCNASLIMHSDAIRKELVKVWDNEKNGKNIGGEDIYAKKGLNICLVSREYPVETGWGGIGNYTYNLAHALTGLGCEVHIIAQSLDIDKEYMDGNVHVHRVAHKTILPFKGNLRELCLRLEYSRSVYIKLKEIIKKFQIDIVEAPNLSGEGFVYSLFKRTPLVTRLHTHFSEVIEFSHWPKTLDRDLSCLFEEAAILRSDLVSCSTKFHAENVFRGIGFNKKKTKIVPLGIALPEIKENHNPGGKNRPVILFVGRLEKRKGAHVLIRAIPLILKKYPQAVFNIIGRDTFVSKDAISFAGDKTLSFKSKLISQIPEEFKKNVNFLGHMERNELAKYYDDCDIFVAPSLYESFGLIYIEAMSYAKPVIGCGVGGVPEVIEDGISGILVPPEDHVSLAENILKLINDNALRINMGKNARERVENNFTDTIMAKRTLEAYRNIL